MRNPIWRVLIPGQPDANVQTQTSAISAVTMQGLMPTPGQSNANMQTDKAATSAVALQGLMPTSGQPDTNIPTEPAKSAVPWQGCV